MPNSRTRAGPCAFHARTAAAENDYKRRRRDNYRQSLGFLEERLTLLRERHSQEEGLWDRRVINTGLGINQVLEEIARLRAELDLVDVQEDTAAFTRERELLRSDMAIS